MRGVGFEPTRISPRDLKSLSLTGLGNPREGIAPPRIELGLSDSKSDVITTTLRGW
jgi:hypothetical protein